jgi:hypothetical protein
VATRVRVAAGCKCIYDNFHTKFVSKSILRYLYPI